MISDTDRKICEKYGLLYDGKHRKRGMNKRVLAGDSLARTYVRTRHHVFITEGYDGIQNSLEYFKKKDIKK